MSNNINITEEMTEDFDDYEKIPLDEPKDEVLVSDKITLDMAKLYQKGKWTDVTLAVRERRFKAHRLILSTRSAYFKSLFESEPDKLLFDLDATFNPDAFELVLEYIYSASVVITRKLADDVTEVALKLGIKPLIETLAGFTGTKLSTENVLQEIQRHFGKNKAALEHCLRYLDHNVKKLVDNMQLLTMPFEIMNEIVKRQTLGIEETELLSVLIAWRREQLLNNDAETVKKQVTQLAQHLKLHLLHPESFFQTLKATGWFSTEVLWDTLTELINSNRGYPIRGGDDDDPKYRIRKPGPKTLKPKRKNGNASGGATGFPIAILGKAATGKTTLLYKLKLGEVVTTIPTVGFNVETVEYKRTKFTLTDCGFKVKNSWMELVSARTAALIWVVDSNNREDDLLVEGVELKELFDKFGKPDMPVLVIANKQDLPNAQSVAGICDGLGLKDLGIKNWFIQAACAASGDGLYEGIDWIHQHVDPDAYDE